MGHSLKTGSKEAAMKRKDVKEDQAKREIRLKKKRNYYKWNKEKENAKDRTRKKLWREQSTPEELCIHNEKHRLVQAKYRAAHKEEIRLKAWTYRQKRKERIRREQAELEYQQFIHELKASGELDEDIDI